MLRFMGSQRVGHDRATELNSLPLAELLSPAGAVDTPNTLGGSSPPCSYVFSPEVRSPLPKLKKRNSYILIPKAVLCSGTEKPVGYSGNREHQEICSRVLKWKLGPLTPSLIVSDNCQTDRLLRVGPRAVHLPSCQGHVSTFLPVPGRSAFIILGLMCKAQ